MSEFALCDTLGYDFNSFVIIEKVFDVFLNCWHYIEEVYFVKFLRLAIWCIELTGIFWNSYFFRIIIDSIRFFDTLSIFGTQKRAPATIKSVHLLKANPKYGPFTQKAIIWKWPHKNFYFFFIEIEIKLHQPKLLIEILLFFPNKKKPSVKHSYDL